MMTALVVVSIAMGILLGYKLGYSRCNYQFRETLGSIRDWSQREFEKNKR